MSQPARAETVTVAASTEPAFRPLSALRDAVNSSSASRHHQAGDPDVGRLRRPRDGKRLLTRRRSRTLSAPEIRKRPSWAAYPVFCGRPGRIVKGNRNMKHLSSPKNVQPVTKFHSEPTTAERMQEVHGFSNSIDSKRRIQDRVHPITRPLTQMSSIRGQTLRQNLLVRMMIASLIILALSTIGTHADAAEHVVEVITRIDPGDPVPGMKSKHKIAVDFKKKTLHRVQVETGTTIGISSTRDKFSEIVMGWNACGRGGVPSNCVKLQLKGQTASGVRVIPNIDYNFSIYVTHDGLSAIRGCHDGYPTYLVKVNGKVLYHFKHKPIRILKLWGDCDINARGHIGDWETP